MASKQPVGRFNLSEISRQTAYIDMRGEAKSTKSFNLVKAKRPASSAVFKP